MPPSKNDGTTVHKVVVKDVPVDAFWSISVYNAQGYYEKNTLNAYTINSITGKKGADSQRQVQVSRGAARGLRGSLAVMRSGHEKMMAPCA